MYSRKANVYITTVLPVLQLASTESGKSDKRTMHILASTKREVVTAIIFSGWMWTEKK